MKTEDLGGEGQNPHWAGRARKTLQQSKKHRNRKWFEMADLYVTTFILKRAELCNNTLQP